MVARSLQKVAGTKRRYFNTPKIPLQTKLAPHLYFDCFSTTGVQVMEQTFDRIFDLCLKSVIAAEGEITPHLHSSAQYRTNCFELFGCDVILDSSLRPHLLEVNVSPSLMGSSPLDKKIKGMVVADLLHIVGLYPHDPALLKKYDTNKATGSAGASSSGKGGAGEVGNPFSFSSLSKMMDGQDKYR
jgi:hypothetical protein